MSVASYIPSYRPDITIQICYVNAFLIKIEL